MRAGFAVDDGRSTVRELRESLILIGLVVSSVSGYIGLAIVAVRLFAKS